jgi:hypothetical protein
VIWRDGRAVRIEPEEEAPSKPHGHSSSRA